MPTAFVPTVGASRTALHAICLGAGKDFPPEELRFRAALTTRKASRTHPGEKISGLKY